MLTPKELDLLSHKLNEVIDATEKSLCPELLKLLKEVSYELYVNSVE